MIQDFESRVLPVLQDFAKRLFPRDEAKQTDLVTIGWYLWRMAINRDDLTADNFSWYAAKRVYSERLGLPGACWGRQRAEPAGTMRDLPDRGPGPEEVAQQREAEERLALILTDQEALVLDMALEGLPGYEMAARLRVTPGRVSQVISQIRNKLQG